MKPRFMPSQGSGIWALAAAGVLGQGRSGREQGEAENGDSAREGRRPANAAVIDFPIFQCTCGSPAVAKRRARAHSEWK